MIVVGSVGQWPVGFIPEFCVGSSERMHIPDGGPKMRCKQACLESLSLVHMCDRKAGMAGHSCADVFPLSADMPESTKPTFLDQMMSRDALGERPTKLRGIETICH